MEQAEDACGNPTLDEIPRSRGIQLTLTGSGRPRPGGPTLELQRDPQTSPGRVTGARGPCKQSLGWERERPRGPLPLLLLPFPALLRHDTTGRRGYYICARTSASPIRKCALDGNSRARRAAFLARQSTRGVDLRDSSKLPSRVTPAWFHRQDPLRSQNEFVEDEGRQCWDSTNYSFESTA